MATKDQTVAVSDTARDIVNTLWSTLILFNEKNECTLFIKCYGDLNLKSQITFASVANSCAKIFLRRLLFSGSRIK